MWRCGGVNNLGAFLACSACQLVNHCYGFNSGFVMQAQHHQVHPGQNLALGFRVFAPLGGDADHFDFRHLLQPFADLQAGGSCFAINEDFGHLAGSWGDFGV